MLNYIVDYSNPGCLHEIDVVSEEISDVPVLAVLLPILKGDLESISSVEVEHLMAIAPHKPLHLVLISRQIEICKSLLDIIVVIA